MANEKNLKPLSAEEARERGRKGGKASGKARQERKKLKDELLLLLADDDTQKKMCVALISQAKRGNIKAFEVIRDTIGEKPITEIEQNNSIVNNNLISIADLIRNPQPNRKLPDVDAE